MSDPFFFGYGSLVNARTHDHPDPSPATVSGWTRSWRHTTRRPYAYLSVMPSEVTSIDGLIARVPENDWTALDKREAGYHRQAIEDDSIKHGRSDPTEVQIYQTHAETDITGRVFYPILLSYLDVVVQGFRDIFGEDGVAAFFTSTEGWEAGILDDRSAPIYPRAQKLSPLETELVNHHIARLPAKVEKL